MSERTPRSPEYLPPTWIGSAASEKGPIRSHNEDVAFTDESLGAGGVFDGVGGGPAGKLAAETAYNSIVPQLASWPRQLLTLQARQEMVSALLQARDNIEKAQVDDPGLTGMSTTGCVAKLFLDETGKTQVVIGSAGDSRAYVEQPDGTIERLTIDDRLPHQNILTNSLGNLRHGPQIIIRPLAPGERIILVTDGLYNGLTDLEIASVLQTSKNSREAAGRLVQAALATGKSRDNISAVVIGRRA